MINIKRGAIELNINKEPGVYDLGMDGGTGKTYLSKVLNLMKEQGILNCLVLTYKSGITEEQYVTQIRDKDYDLIFLDRFILYVTGAICKELERVSKNTIVLMDLKDLTCYTEPTLGNAELKLAMGRIEVN